MALIKIWLHFCAAIKKVLYKIIYRKKLTIGKGTTWRKHFNLMLAPTGQVLIGENCFFNNDCSINCLESIEIGEGSIFGENVRIYDHNHKFNTKDKPLKEQGYTYEPIRIGKHCWIGSNVTILKGAHIGDNCVIGAGCTISEYIEDGKLVRNEAHILIEDIDFGEE